MKTKEKNGIIKHFYEVLEEDFKKGPQEVWTSFEWKKKDDGEMVLINKSHVIQRKYKLIEDETSSTETLRTRWTIMDKGSYYELRATQEQELSPQNVMRLANALRQKHDHLLVESNKFKVAEEDLHKWVPHVRRAREIMNKEFADARTLAGDCDVLDADAKLLPDVPVDKESKDEVKKDDGN